MQQKSTGDKDGIRTHACKAQMEQQRVQIEQQQAQIEQQKFQLEQQNEQGRQQMPVFLEALRNIGNCQVPASNQEAASRNTFAVPSFSPFDQTSEYGDLTGYKLWIIDVLLKSCG